MKDLTAVSEAMNLKTAANVSKDDIVTVYNGKDAKVYAVQVAAMTILCNVYPDGSFKVTTVVW